MRVATLALGLAAFLLLGRAATADDKDLDKLKGKWTVLSVERDGKELENFKDGTREIDSDKYTLTPKSGAKHSGTFKVDSGKKPKTMDMVPDGGQYKGKTLQGIYEIDGDTLKICFAEPGKDRPTEFTSKGGQVLAVHKRAK